MTSADRKFLDAQKCQGAPVEVWQACTEFSSGGQVVAGSAAAAQELMSHDLDLQSPEKVSTASQVGCTPIDLA